MVCAGHQLWGRDPSAVFQPRWRRVDPRHQWKIEDTLKRLDLGDEWFVWRIWHWSKGATPPDQIRYEWSFLDILRALDTLDAFAEIEQIVNAPEK
tara:strand:- start:209 stop:493 length:285 start_codon:yes stop_codon:yes gene_type:complete